MTEPLLLDQFIPQYDDAVVYSQVLRAPPQQCFEALVDMDILQIPVIRLLIRARGLPQRVADAVRGRGAEAKEASWPATFRVRDLAPLGWIKLGERPGTELVFGIVSKPWQPVTGRPGEPVARRSSSADSTSPGSPRSRRAPASTRMATVSRDCGIARCTDRASRVRRSRSVPSRNHPASPGPSIGIFSSLYWQFQARSRSSSSGGTYS
jgi:hypothetical protein